MTSTQQKGISSERVHGLSSVTIDHFECSICQDILWKPVACQSCETPFCLSCINQWLVRHPAQCPYQCETYIERKCPPFIAKFLAQLQITCFYQSNGCQQVLSYEALDKHEAECDYQFQQCPDCDMNILKKDFPLHENTCDRVKLKCNECKLIYKRNEADKKHTDKICLKKKIKRLKHETKENKQEIRNLHSELTHLYKLHPFLTQEIISFDDLPSAIHGPLSISNTYRGLQWDGIRYVHELFIKKYHLNTAYATSFMPAGSLHIAYTSYDASSIHIEPSNETFTLVSLTAAAAWRDNMLLNILAFRNSQIVYGYKVTLLYGRPQCFSLNWTNIDKVIFKTLGGIPHSNLNTFDGQNVIITQLIVDNVTKNNNN